MNIPYPLFLSFIALSLIPYLPFFIPYTGSHPCDRRRNITEHSVSYPHIDFTPITHDTDPLYYKSEGREDEESVTQRGFEFFNWLKARSEKEIIIVSHGAFLYNTFNNVIELDDEYLKLNLNDNIFRNCEMKSYYMTF